MEFTRIAPQWIVPDVKDIVEFYRVKVGFELEWIGDPPLFAIMRRDNFAIMFRQLKVNGFTGPPLCKPVGRPRQRELGMHMCG